MKTDSLFIGRTKELQQLEALYQRKKPHLVVLKGRRRIGKSRLVFEFARRKTTSSKNSLWNFAGLAPIEGVSAQAERDQFARQLSLILKLPPMTFQDWSDAFEHLSLHLQPGDIILLDEISWMGSQDPTFIPKLKAWWDKQTLRVMLFLCGSVSTWIEENILNSTSFFGRINLSLTLEPLSLSESAYFLRKSGIKLSDYDLYKLLSIAGGVPWYLEQFHPKMTADEIIKQLAFQKEGLFLTEFDCIFYDLFQGRGKTYHKILDSLKGGAKTLAEIRHSITFAHSGTLSQMMEHLVIAGFVAKEPLWSLKTGKNSKQSLYRISDPYLRFYLKMVLPNLPAIKEKAFEKLPLSSLPGWEAHLGLQVETLLLQNRYLLAEKIGISPLDIIRSGPYRQSKTSTQAGCQIDYLIQTKTNNLFLCEFKFKKGTIKSDIIAEVEEKIRKLKAPKSFSRIPVLFHLSELSDTLATEDYFYRTVAITDFLEE